MMKQKRAILRFFLVLLAALLALLLPGCSREESDEELAEAFTNLMAGDYEVRYLFLFGGLPTDAAVSMEYDGGTYRQVVSSEYKNIEDLQRLLSSVYARTEESDAMLARTDQNGRPQLIEQAGTLWVSADWRLESASAELIEDSVRVEEKEKDYARMYFEEAAADGSLLAASIGMTRTGDGWRLAEDPGAAERTVLREGSGETQLSAPGELRAMAESFLQALQTGNTAQLERLSWAPAGTYADLAAAKVTEARITGTESEGEAYAAYTVRLSVEDGAGILPEGESMFRIAAGMPDSFLWEAPDGAKELSVTVFAPLESERKTADYERAAAVYSLLALGGPVAFETTQELPSDLATEYLLSQIYDYSYTSGVSREELAAAAEKYLGLSDFKPDGDFYDAQLNGYIVYGHGGAVYNGVLYEVPEIPVQADAAFDLALYSDPLRLRQTARVRYTLESLPEGEWRLLSGQVLEGSLEGVRYSFM